MAIVGNFPGIEIQNRKTIRAPLNPLDKCTIVSIFPKHVPPEIKHTIQPGVFQIPYGTYENPGVLVVGSSSWWREIDENQPLLEIPNSSIQVADSVVMDFCNGLLACNMSDVMPGLFYIPGEKTALQVKKENQIQLDKAKSNQKRWFEALVKMADMLWARSNGNPLTIGDDMRLAAHELNLNDKEWIKDFQSIEMSRCKACSTLIRSDVIVCPNCKLILNEAKAKELNFKFAQ